MIQFALKCSDGHRFDSWFSSGDAFDKLQASKMITCPVCASSDISKELMAPSVRPGRKKDAVKAAAQPEPGPLSAPATPAEQMIAEMRARVESSSEYVGNAFASQARAMHDGDAPEKSIYGEANPEDARQLIEDGIPVLPLPFRPSGKSN
ncbi:MAG: DUF1178 family protein [Pseudomonadota bacterium]